ncbi:MAG: YeeE/YedE family protein [Planctomycetota bacterium]|jgi:uncharacterized membrane protein YedE/YeeE
MDLFPNGIGSYLIGGVLVGVGIAGIYLVVGRLAGVSSILTSVQSFWSRRLYFRQGWVRDDWNWKIWMIAGLVAGGALWLLFTGTPYVTDVEPWRLAVGGVFVGFGTRMARGCTSGHGICGVSGLGLPSIASTMTFLGTAIVVANIFARVGS